MDRLYSFQSKHIGELKNVEQKNFYSEEECDTPPCKKLDSKPSKFAKKNEFQTDDSDDSPKPQIVSPRAQNKLSKFKQIANHLESSDENNIQFEDIQPDESVELQSKMMQDKYQQPKKPQQIGVFHKSNSSRILIKDDATKLSEHPFKHLIHGKIDYKQFIKFLQLTQRGLIYSRSCLKGPTDKFIRSRQVRLPDGKDVKQKTLLLDLDETLIHSCTLRENPKAFVIAQGEFGSEIKVKLHQKKKKIYFNIRPYCKDFLKNMSQYFNIYVYTASSYAYAYSIIDYLDPEAKYIIDILTRNNCLETKNGFFIKDLRIISNRKLKDVIIVDNLTHSFGFQIENGVPILEWFDDEKDEELKYLQDYLIKLSKEDDMRQMNAQNLKLNELIDFQIE